MNLIINNNNTLLLGYKLNFNINKKNKNIYLKNINNIFVKLYFAKVLLFFFNKKFVINNIKKYFYFRLCYFFFKKNIFFSFWFFQSNIFTFKNRFFFFNSFNVIFFRNLLLLNSYTFNIALFFFFNVYCNFNFLNTGLKGFLKNSNIFYTKLYFRNIINLSIHGVKKYKKYYSPLFYKYQQIYHTFPPFVKNKNKKNLLFFFNKKFVRNYDRQDYHNKFICSKNKLIADYKLSSALVGNFLQIKQIKKHNTFFFDLTFNFNFFICDFIFFYLFIDTVNISAILINYINTLYCFWLFEYKYTSLNKPTSLIENKYYNVKKNYYTRSLFIKIKYHANSVYLTNYNFVKFFTFCFNILFSKNFYYLQIDYPSGTKISTNLYKKFLHAAKSKCACINNLNLPLYFNKEKYILKFINKFINFSSLFNNVYAVNKFLTKNPNNAFITFINLSILNLVNYKFIYESTKKIWFIFKKDKIKHIPLNAENVFFSKLITFSYKASMKFNSYLFENNLLKNRLTSSLFISKNIKNIKKANVQVFDQFSNFYFNYIPSFSYLVNKFYTFWRNRVNFWKRFRFFNDNYVHRFIDKLLYFRNYFKFLEKDRSFFLKKQYNSTLLNFKNFNFYLLDSNRLYLLLSGNFLLFNFFNFFTKYHSKDKLVSFFLSSRFSFRIVNIIFKFVIKKKLKIKSQRSLTNKLDSSIKIYNLLYKNLFLYKTKFFYLKNNLNSLLKKYKFSFRISLYRSHFFHYLNKSLYGFNFFLKIHKCFLEIQNNYVSCQDFSIFLWSKTLLNILLNFDNLYNNNLKNNFYLDYYYKYKQLFFFLGKQITTKNVSLFNSFNFSLFLYNKNYNWFFFNYFWKWFFINIIFKNNINIIPKNNIDFLLKKDQFIFSKKNQFSFYLNFNNNNFSQFNHMSSVVKYILNKNLLFFDECYWFNIFHLKLKKNIIYNKLQKRFGKPCISAKYFTFNFFNKKKKMRAKYLFHSKKFDFLKKLHTHKLYLLDKIVILVINIQLNNTFITLTDIFGNVLLKASAGLLGIKGPKRATPVATEEITNFVCQYILNNNYNFLILRLNGVLRTRKMKSAIKAISDYNFIILRAFNYTPKAHNGIRFKKRKRL